MDMRRTDPGKPAEREYNPHVEELRERRRSLHGVCQDREIIAAELEWHAGFDRASEASGAVAMRDEIAKRAGQLASAEAELAALDERMPDLALAARMGWDPRYWFSKELRGHRRALSAHRRRRKRQFHEVERARLAWDTGTRFLQSVEEDLARYDAIDPVALRRALREMDVEVARLEREVDACRQACEAAELKLEAPLRDLRALQAGEATLRRELERLDELQSTLDRGDSSERYKIHQTCEQVYGVRSPNAARKIWSGRLRGNQRDQAKLRERLEGISRQEARRVRAIVVDGNNLCYAGGDELVGLGALQAVANRLAERYPVTVVFDRGIVGLLRMRVSEIKAHFDPAVRVHVCQGRADSTVLTVAAGSDSVVISNDRFGEFRDEAAVREDRVLRHEIVGDRVMVHELGLALGFRRLMDSSGLAQDAQGAPVPG